MDMGVMMCQSGRDGQVRSVIAGAAGWRDVAG